MGYEETVPQSEFTNIDWLRPFYLKGALQPALSEL